MICPDCKADNDHVIDTRDSDHGHAVRRRRMCSCGHRWTTYERIGSDKPELTAEEVASAKALAKRMLAAAEALCRGLTKE
jgi:transcriptional regulator NrdR family protein